MIDIKSILDELSIDYKSSGKNVGSADLNIDCPYCYADKHLGISVNTGFVNCWICEFEDSYYKSKKGDMIRPGIVQVLVEATDASWREVKEILERNGWSSIASDSENEMSLSESCSFPAGAEPFTVKSAEQNLASQYLWSRRFSRDTANRYNLRVAGRGPYSGRIIIPVYLDGEMVCYTSRDYTGEQDRYKNSFFTDSKLRLRDTLYNYDVARKFDNAHLVEGPTDVWRMGADTLGVFRSALSRGQRNLIIQANFQSLTIIFDPSATSRAYTIAGELSPFIPEIKVVRLVGEKDVDDLGRKTILSMKEESGIFRG